MYEDICNPNHKITFTPKDDILFNKRYSNVIQLQKKTFKTNLCMNDVRVSIKGELCMHGYGFVHNIMAKTFPMLLVVSMVM